MKELRQGEILNFTTHQGTFIGIVVSISERSSSVKILTPDGLVDFIQVDTIQDVAYAKHMVTAAKKRQMEFYVLAESRVIQKKLQMAQLQTEIQQLTDGQNINRRRMAIKDCGKRKLKEDTRESREASESIH